MPDTGSREPQNDSTATSQGAQSIAEQYAAFALDLKPEDIPVDVRERSKHLILDALGCALASTHYEFADKTFAGLRALGDLGGGEGESSIINMPGTLPLRDALTMNAALVHGLDYDDTHMSAVVHASAVAIPPALTIGEAVNASGADILASYIIAMETAIRLGMAADFGFHHHGYHATGVVGHFSSALVAGRLYGLTVAQLASAQGILVSMATASQEFLKDGAWNKRLHPGWAAVGGITAAFLAKEGFVGTGKPYEGEHGIFGLHLGEKGKKIDFGLLTKELGSRWDVIDMAIKPYPVCHFIHGVCDSAIALRNEHNLKPADIKSIRILVPEEPMYVVTEPEELKKRPDAYYTAKFSAFYVVACGLARGKLGLAELEDEVLTDPDILALCARSTCEPDPESRFPEFFSGGVIIETNDGRTLRHHEPINRGAGERQLTNDEIIEKFMENASLVGDAANAERLRDHILNLEQLDGKAFATGLAKK